jgi:3-methylfumaryl-CoA hydratase
MELARRQQESKRMVAFSFRAVSPVFDIASFQISGRSSDDGRAAQLWASKEDGSLAMKADAIFS